MRKIYYLIIVCMVLSASSVSFAAGWYKTEWGMTKDEVSSAVGEGMLPSSESIANQRIDYEIKGFDVGGTRCNIKMSFPANKLSFVMVQVANPSYGEFLKLYDMLLGKYGQPSTPKNEKKMMGGGRISSAEWLTEDTIITLNYALIPIGGASDVVNVQYKPRAQAGASKL
ncbi:hypothetical protein [Nitratidesulfovibrio liaohensis]|uniref:Uncharacterized protein n=1 Tax=Nitratidesulfovibrio liaohensis TaxID=2604158 RepID=A0ABY9QZB7_9BACT|nr:hypothetical protein [Nitratidesulfovibrio liaohensis]WMW64411.1 hypothetical protein KPS_002423 [Nitratidesulfovibrio liaohensis]